MKNHIYIFINDYVVARRTSHVARRTSHVLIRTNTEYFYHSRIKYLSVHIIVAIIVIIIIGIVMISYTYETIIIGRVVSDVDALNGNSVTASSIITMCQQLQHIPHEHIWKVNGKYRTQSCANNLCHSHKAERENNTDRLRWKIELCLDERSIHFYIIVHCAQCPASLIRHTYICTARQITTTDTIDAADSSILFPTHAH